ncbi:MAG: O-methyltransferase [Ferruginibacter sp.]
MNWLNPEVESYVQHYSSDTDPLLAELQAYTMANHPHAHMLSGSYQGQLLRLLSAMIQPCRVLEIGTFTGYSALCLAAGLVEGGQLHTIELREADAELARTYFNRSLYNEQIRLHVGDANAIIPSLDETWDLVFIDADKVGYIPYYELTLPRLRPGGWILADNVLFHGQVLAQPPEGKNAKAIQAFNEHVAKDHRVEQLMLPVRDGITLIRKKP